MVDSAAQARVKIFERILPYSSVDGEEDRMKIGGARLAAFLASQIIEDTGKNPIPGNIPALVDRFDMIVKTIDNDEARSLFLGPVIEDEVLASTVAEAAELIVESKRHLNG